MEEIVIQIKDKQKVQWLTNLLQALDFVTSVRVAHKKMSSVPVKTKQTPIFLPMLGSGQIEICLSRPCAIKHGPASNDDSL